LDGVGVRERILAGDMVLIAELVEAGWPRFGRGPIGRGAEHAELVQEATRAVYEAARAFDPREGDFRDVAVDVIRRRVRSLLRRARRERGRLVALNWRDADEIPGTEDRDPFADQVESPELARALRRLSPRLRALLVRVYWQGRTTTEVAAEQGVSPEALRRARRRAEAMLRRELRGSPAERMRRLRH
jgi:RNA polymerase sigma factor (sigma-70 family)